MLFDKRGKSIENKIQIPLKISNIKTKKPDIKDFTLINIFADTSAKVSQKLSNVKIINLKEKLDLSAINRSHKPICFSSAYNLKDVKFQNIYRNKDINPIGVELYVNEIAILLTDNPLPYLNSQFSDELKEKFMVVITQNCNKDNARLLRNSLRPEYLLVITDSNKNEKIENINFLSNEESIRITKDIKGMIKLVPVSPKAPYGW